MITLSSYSNGLVTCSLSQMTVFLSLILFMTNSLGTKVMTTHAYHRVPCKTSSVRRQFQFSQCYAPNLNLDLNLNQVSFVMSHNSATGYLNTKYVSNSKAYDNDAFVSSKNNNNGLKNTFTTKLLSLYGKTQVGSAYDQLNDGARALDLRPKIYSNGTIGFHHGDLIDISLSSITLGHFLDDVKKWCQDNPEELVILFHSELVHEEGYGALSPKIYVETDTNHGYQFFGIASMMEVYQSHGVPYYSCEQLSGLTVADTLSMGNLSQFGGVGYLLAVDRHDMYASFCGKANWAQNQLVTCYSFNDKTYQNFQNQSKSIDANAQSYFQCTDRRHSGQYTLNALKSYVKASANNEPSDNANELGPPVDEYWYPFNQIQGFWQVDASSVQLGLSHGSTLLDDNRISKINEELILMAYKEEFNSVSIFSLDNVALNGNAMFSVLRNACGQSVIKSDDDTPPCGQDLMMPLMMSSGPLSLFWSTIYFLMYGSLAVVIAAMLVKAFSLRDEGPQEHRIMCNGEIV